MIVYIQGAILNDDHKTYFLNVKLLDLHGDTSRFTFILFGYNNISTRRCCICFYRHSLARMR